MVVTDSPYLKGWIAKSYDTQQQQHTNSTSNVGGASLLREVVTTRSRGAHTRTQRGPSTAEFAEAFIDWYLLGESDIVVTNGFSPSFGGTATLRTARPLYRALTTGDKCRKVKLLHDNDDVKTAR